MSASSPQDSSSIHATVLATAPDRSKPWLVGVAFLAIGIVLAAAAIALGG